MATKSFVRIDREGISMDLEKLRNETPGCSERIHLNNAGASLMPDRVLQAVITHLNLESKIGGYEAAAERAGAVKDFYSRAAKLLKCLPSEVAFTDSATRAWNSFVYGLSLKPGDVILTSRIEFGSNVVSLRDIADRCGARMVVLPSCEDGSVDVRQVESHLDDKVKLVALTQLPAHSGVINPVCQIGRLLESSDCLFLVDACQSAGQMDLDVGALRCDALVTTGRKWLRGPRGTGLIYVRSGVAEGVRPPTIDLANTDLIASNDGGSSLVVSADAKRFEIWERSIAGLLGFSEALAYIDELGFDFIAHRNALLASALRAGLSSMHDLVLSSDSGIGGTVSFYSRKKSADEVKRTLGELGINVSVLHDWDSPLEFRARGWPPLVRVSPHYYNTEDEVRVVLEAIEHAIA